MNFWNHVLDWFYPRKCGLCGQLGAEVICVECHSEFERIKDPLIFLPGALNWKYSIFHYEGRSGQAVRRLKYGRVSSLSMAMSQILESHRGSLPYHELIVPVPIHRLRMHTRGFNQALLLCEAMPKDLVENALIFRTRNTPPQARLNLEQRSRNLFGAFEAKVNIEGKSVLIVDDVITSGSTALACAEALKAAGAKQVGALAFCGESYTSGLKTQ